VSSDPTSKATAPGGGVWQSLESLFFLRREVVRIAVIWLVLGSVLAEFAASVRDYMDFDAGRYERLAISIARTHSVVPRINGVNIHYLSMLYPLLLAPFFATGALWKALQNADIASAYIMSSACIPAFLLARRVTRPRWWGPYFVAVFTVCTPWIVTSMSLMTEVAAYPACAWAIYAIVVAVSSPSRSHDLLAVLGCALAFLARGELIVLLFVLPVAILAFELGRPVDQDFRGRLADAGRSILKGHPLLVIGYSIVTVTVATLSVLGRLSSTIGIYSVYSSAGYPAWIRLPRSLVEHLATFSLGVAVIPCVIALAWIGANVLRPTVKREAHAFACVSAVAIVVVFIQATNFDLVVNAYIHDRFLMYFVPVILIGAVLGITDARPPRWSLIVPLTLIVAGFAFGAIPFVTWGEFPWLDIDTPISTDYRVLANHLGGLTEARALLIAIAISGTALVAIAARRRIRVRYLSIAVFGFSGIVMFATTAWTFQRAFNSPDRNSRPLTATQHGTLDWIDGDLGPNARVTAIQAPISSDWFVNEGTWVDYEYFNKSVVRDARIAGSNPFDYTGFWFPKLDLRFNPDTGGVAESPTRWIAASIKETRFRIAGPAKFYNSNLMLIDAGPRWRLAWLTSGIYDDGWTKPGATVRIRLYPTPSQRTARIRSVGFVLRAPQDIPRRVVTVTAQGQRTRVIVTPSATNAYARVCVPTRGNAEIQMKVNGSSGIPGDLATLATSRMPRRGGMFIASIGEADELGSACSRPRSQARP
jgi:hypothetical protein